MTTLRLRAVTPFASIASIRCTGAALLAAAALLGACGSQESSGPTQVVAKVSGAEITELQVNQALERQPGLKPEQLEPVSRSVVLGLVEQELVLQKARDLKLDRDQRVVQTLEALRRETLARAYLDRIADGVTKPAPKDVQAYYDANPVLFAQRRLYTFQDYSMQVSPAQRSAIETQLTALKSPVELDAYLKDKQIASRTERTTIAAENLPVGLLPRVAAMQPSQGLIMAGPAGLRVLLLLSAQDSPATFAQARPSIDAYLLNQRKRQAIDKELAALHSGAKVEFFGKYAGLAASAAAAPGSASAAAAPGPAASGSVKATAAFEAAGTPAALAPAAPSLPAVSPAPSAPTPAPLLSSKALSGLR